MDARRQLTAETVCGIILQPLNCNLGSGHNLEWNINIDEAGQTEITEQKNEIPNTPEDELTIVHITDTHYDPHYREGANAECGVPVCCRYKQVIRFFTIILHKNNILVFAGFPNISRKSSRSLG